MIMVKFGKTEIVKERFYAAKKIKLQKKTKDH